MDEVEVLEKESDVVCFICKDGGTLMLCDFKGCPKVYHESCIEKDSSVSKNGDSFICMWHSCYKCKKKPKLWCLSCPHAVCEGCVTHPEFIQVKENKGICDECQEYVFALEEMKEYGGDGDEVDLTDPGTFESMFLWYWEFVKQEEDITFEEVLSVCAPKSRKKSGKLKYEDDPDFSLSDVDEVDYKTSKFMGWGSKPLIEFLNSIGEDTKDAMSQHSVESVIRTYIREKNLLDPVKKKKVNCDEKLYSIFRKQSLHKNRIYKLLNAHFRENLAPLEHGPSEKNETILLPSKKQKIESSDDKKETEPEMRATGLAKINLENIKLVYLRKGLVVELLKQNETFADKVMGSFVKVKNDPRDIIAFQVLQVTDVNSDDENEGVILHVDGMTSGVKISKLDDSDIIEEEINYLKQKVMNGLLRQPSVVEMEQKAKDLHDDITKHWITRQLKILQRRIDRANEKGWRRELEEYLDERELLKKPSEQERLLKETPRIVEEFIEFKQEAAASSDSRKQGNLNDEEIPTDQTVRKRIPNRKYIN